MWKGEIFDQWYGQMCCPKCSTIQNTSAGYPRPGLGGLGYCEPDDGCDGCKWPGGYNKWSIQKIEECLKSDISDLSKPEIIKALTELKSKNNLNYLMLLKRLKIKGEMKKRHLRMRSENINNKNADAGVFPGNAGKGS